MAESKPSSQELRVVIEGLDAGAEQVQRLGTALQKAVLNEIAQLKMFDTFQVHFPRDWIGIVIRPPELLS
jgi:hypothetical protein